MKPVTLYMYRSDDALKWYPHQRILYDAFVASLKGEDSVEVRFRRQVRQKTNKQLGYWFAVLVPHTEEALREAGHNTIFDVSVGELTTGVETSTDTVDLLLKTLYKAYKLLDKLPRKREMSTEEMSGLIDFSLKWVAENLGTYIPTPEV